MTDQTETPRPSPTARELFESVDALMRRNRRTGTATAPLPPPEGRIIPSAFIDETQALSAEIEAALEAERVRETARVENTVPEGAASASDIPESQPSVMAEEVVAQGTTEEAFAGAAVAEDGANAPAAALSDESVPEETGEEVPKEDDVSLAGWLREMLPAESLALIDRILPGKAEPGAPLLADAATEEAEPTDGSKATEIPGTTVHTETIVAEGEVGEDVAAPMKTPPGEASARREDDLLLWEFVPSPQDVAETAAVSDAAFSEVDEAKPPKDASLFLAPPFSEVISFLSELEVLASPSQSSASYVTTPPTVAFDNVAEDEPTVMGLEPDVFSEETTLVSPLSEEECTAAAWKAGVSPEAVPEEGVVFTEEIAWRPADEEEEASSAIDAGMAMNVAEALAPLSDAEALEAGEALPLEEVSTGLWHLVETENLPEVMPLSALPEAAETEAAAVEEAVLSAAAPEDSQKIDDGEAFERVSPESSEPVLVDAGDPGTDDEEIVLQPVIEDWADDARMDDEPDVELERIAAPAGEASIDVGGDAFLKEEEALKAGRGITESSVPVEGVSSEEPVVVLDAAPEDLIPVLSIEDIVVVAGEEEVPFEKAVAVEAPSSPSGFVPSGTEAPSLTEEPVVAVEDEALAVAERAALFESALPKATVSSQLSAAALLSEQRQRDYEARMPAMRYSAAQMLTEYQRQNPPAQNAKKAVSPQSVEPLTAAVLTLVDDDDMPLPYAIAVQNPPEAAIEVARAPFAPARKETALELTLEPLPGEGAWSGRPAALQAAASPTPGNVLLDEEGYYPVLTDIVDGDEFSVSSRV